MHTTPEDTERQPRRDLILAPARAPIPGPSRRDRWAADLSTQLLSIRSHRWGEPRVVDLRTLVSDMDLGRFFTGHTVFCSDFATVPCPVQVDSLPLEEVVAGLVLNAREAVGHSGTVLVRIDHLTGKRIAGRSGTGWVMLEVSDSGRGRDTEPLRAPNASGCGTTVRVWLPAVTPG